MYSYVLVTKFRRIDGDWFVSLPFILVASFVSASIVVALASQCVRLSILLLLFLAVEISRLERTFEFVDVKIALSLLYGCVLQSL